MANRAQGRRDVMEEIQNIDCSGCGKRLVIDLKNCPRSIRSWCSPECHDAWNEKHPEEAAKWIAVEDMTIAQRAEIDALLGCGKRGNN